MDETTDATTLPVWLRPEQAEVERRLLGGLIRHPEDLPAVEALLGPADFQFDAHGRLFAAVREQPRGGSRIDVAVLAGTLHRQGRLDDAGGYAYLARLLQDEPTGFQNLALAGLVRDMAARAKLARAAQDLAARASVGGESAADLVAEWSAVAAELNERASPRLPVPLSTAVAEAVAAYDGRKAGGGRQGLSTGIDVLDNALAGLHAGEFVVLAARPSIGKTALAIQIAREVAGAGARVFFASCEQPRDQIAERLICQVASLNSHAVRRARLDAEDERRFGEAADELSPQPVEIDDASNQDVRRIAANARRFALQPRGLDLIVLDYLQLLKPRDARQKRHESVGADARDLRALAKELGVPVLCLAQLNREVESRNEGRPKLSDLRDSGEIEAHADVVVLMHRRPDQVVGSPLTQLELIVAKQRNGPIGPVVVDFRAACYRFEPNIPG